MSCQRLIPLLVLLSAMACSESEPSAPRAVEKPPATDPDPDPIAIPPSILLVTFDTLRADHLGAYGHPDDPTPNLDALAKQALLLERAVAASSRTAPSHASIMTSRFVRDHNIQHGNGKTRLGDEPTLARILSNNGYATAAFISNSVLQRRTGFDAGFDVFDDDLTDLELNRPTAERKAEDTANRALAWLSTAERPFFLWLHLNDAHGPYTPPPGFLDGVLGSAPPEFPGAGDEILPVLSRQDGFRGIPAYQALPGVEHESEYRARYVAEIRYADQQFARIFDAAKSMAGDSGLITAITSDHGESMGEEQYHLAHGHATTPDLVHVPMLFVAPGLRPGRASDPAHHIDVLPTLLGLAKIEAPPGLAGIDLSLAWRGQATLPDRILFSDVGREISAYRANSFIRHRYHEDAKTPTRTMHAWSQTAPWDTQEIDSEIADALDAYIAREGKFILAPAPTPDLNAQLRALGYLEPETDGN